MATGGSEPTAFLLPVRALKKLFRGKFLAALKQAEQDGDLPSSHLPTVDALYRKSWVVYCKPPFGSPEQVLAYLARYTHRVAISNQRSVRLEDQGWAHLEGLHRGEPQPRNHSRRGVSPPIPLARPAGPLREDPLLRFFPNRHQEQSGSLPRGSAGSATSTRAHEVRLQSLLQSLTGVDPLRCEVCGQKALRLVEELSPAHAPRASPR